MTEPKINIHDLINKFQTSKSNSKTTPSEYIIRKPSKDILIKMLQREEEIRFSSEYINKCNDVASEPNGWLRISGDFQKQVATEFGFISSIENDIAVNHMRRAQYIYPDEPLFKTIPVYVRNNLANKGKFSTNDVVPNIVLHKLLDTVDNESASGTTDHISLYQTFDKTRPNVLIASSHT
jgi:hypothetical protein